MQLFTNNLITSIPIIYICDLIGVQCFNMSHRKTSKMMYFVFTEMTRLIALCTVVLFSTKAFGKGRGGGHLHGLLGGGAGKHS